ncbi:MAG: sulfatase-like hydrolase/transferase, partial [Cereibacter changlensis]
APGTTGAQEAPGFVTRERPNIILVSSDDQRLDEMPFLPEVERLIGEEGVTFDNAITPHPLCCPARAELMTGQLAQNNGVRGNFPPQGGYEAFDESQHIGVWLQEAGYTTAFLGKMLNGYSKHEGRDPGQARSQKHPLHRQIEAQHAVLGVDEHEVEPPGSGDLDGGGTAGIDVHAEHRPARREPVAQPGVHASIPSAAGAAQMR